MVRVSSSGPPVDFATRAEADARIAAIEGGARMPQHTYLDIVAYEGPLGLSLAEAGILR